MISENFFLKMDSLQPFLRIYFTNSAAKHDPLHELTVQEKDLIWKVREYCQHSFPQLLPRIIDCVNYAKRDQVAEIHR